MDKTCFKCKRTLLFSEFYKHPMMGDGHLGKCKDCTRADSESNRQRKMKDPAWVEAEAARHRAKEKSRGARFPEILAARRAVKKTVEKGFHQHHWSYLREHRLDVFRLTPQEHRRAHRHLVYDVERMQFRRCDTMQLLDSREAHAKFLDSLKSKPF